MSQEQRVWVAAILSAIVMVGYAQTMGRQLKASRPAASTPPAVETEPQIIQQDASEYPQLIDKEEVTTIESEDVRLEIGLASAAVRSVELKKFDAIETRESLRFGDGAPALSVSVGGMATRWVEQSRGPNKVSWTTTVSASVDATLSISIGYSGPTYFVETALHNRSDADETVPVKLISSWNRGDEASGRNNLLEAVLNTNKQHGWQRQYLTYHSGSTSPRIVPRGTSILTLSERFFCQSIKPSRSDNTATILPSSHDRLIGALQADVVVPERGEASYSANIYAGPRDFFVLRVAGFEQAFPIGLLGKIGLILVVFLKGLAGIVRNYGIAIVLLSAIVTTALSPFTMLSFKSMKKMQELQPKMDHLKKKHEKDSKKMNQEMLMLFREHKVSPMSGCLPMLIQMPIFFALWSAISHVIEFRGERFLWIQDLSLPDRLAKLPFGFDLNILPILMAIAMYVQTKMTQKQTVTAGTPSMLSGPLMSVMFGVMFYSVPSSLVLYWLTNSSISVLWYRSIK